jgi:mannose-6-phosphate isomerase-like protein (cupin superfamily)
MRRTLIASIVAVFPLAVLSGQTPAPPAAPPASPPAAPATRPAAPRPAAAGRPATLAIQVTDGLGVPLADTQVATAGPVSREGTTGPDGSIRFTNVRPGTYRLKFTREGSITFEREVTVRAGETSTTDVALNPAPPPPKPVVVETPAPATPPPLPPSGDPKVTPVPQFLERNFIGGREARKDSSLGCTPTATATLHQLRDSWLSHSHDDADEWIYVVAGEGTIRIGSSEQRLQAGTFGLVPHGMAHALIPQGRNPLIVTSVLSGPACKG